MLRHRYARTGQRAIVYFISDLDPSGLDLQRAWEEALANFGVRVAAFVRIGLTREQVRGLPPRLREGIAVKRPNPITGSWAATAVPRPTLRNTATAAGRPTSPGCRPSSRRSTYCAWLDGKGGGSAAPPRSSAAAPCCRGISSHRSSTRGAAGMAATGRNCRAEPRKPGTPSRGVRSGTDAFIRAQWSTRFSLIAAAAEALKVSRRSLAPLSVIVRQQFAGFIVRLDLLHQT